MNIYLITDYKSSTPLLAANIENKFIRKSKDLQHDASECLLRQNLRSTWLRQALPDSPDQSILWRAIWRAMRVFTAIGVGILALMAAARALRIEEFTDAMSRVTRRFASR